MKQHKARIKVTSRSFSRHPVLKLELLEVEITHLTRPQRLEALAVQHLGLSVPSLAQHGILRLVQNDFAAPATTLPTAYTE